MPAWGATGAYSKSGASEELCHRTRDWRSLQSAAQLPGAAWSRYGANLFIYQARESSLVPAEFLTAQYAVPAETVDL